MNKKLSCILSVFLLSFFLTFPVSGKVLASEYISHEPILVENIQASMDDPYIIEGYDITTQGHNCIEIRNCTNVIVRNNYLHDSNINQNAEHYGIDFHDFSVGTYLSIFADNCTGITIENNVLKNNRKGLLITNSHDITVKDNDIQNTVITLSLSLERCENAEICGNYLEDNGIPEWFWAPGNRIMGIFIQQSNSLDIHDNTIIRSSSDGILVMGINYGGTYTSPSQDWTTSANDIRIYNNTILDNMELGICMIRLTDVEVYNNTIRAGLFTNGSCIRMELEVNDIAIYNNSFTSARDEIPTSALLSHDCYIHDNACYRLINDDNRDTFCILVDSGQGLEEKLEWAGLTEVEPSSIISENNIYYQIGGELGEVMEAKLEISEREKTYVEKGRYAAETSEGVYDENIMEEEFAKGDQGIPYEYLVFDPLMADSSKYAIGEVQEKTGEETIFEPEIIDHPEVKEPNEEIRNEIPEQPQEFEDTEDSTRPAEIIIPIVIIAGIILVGIFIYMRYRTPRV